MNFYWRGVFSRPKKSVKYVCDISNNDLGSLLTQPRAGFCICATNCHLSFRQRKIGNVEFRAAKPANISVDIFSDIAWSHNIIREFSRWSIDIHFWPKSLELVYQISRLNLRLFSSNIKRNLSMNENSIYEGLFILSENRLQY